MAKGLRPYRSCLSMHDFLDKDILWYICSIWGLDTELPLDLMHNICLTISMRLRYGKVKPKEAWTNARSIDLGFGITLMP